jgi:hypothetical protein
MQKGAFQGMCEGNSLRCTWSQKIEDIQLDVVVHTYNPSYSGGGGRSIQNPRQAQAKLARPPSQKQNIKQRTGSAAQVVEHLPSQHKTPSLSPSTPCPKENNKKRLGLEVWLNQ